MIKLSDHILTCIKIAILFANLLYLFMHIYDPMMSFPLVQTALVAEPGQIGRDASRKASGENGLCD